MTYYTGEVGVYTYDANHNMLTSSLGDGVLETEYEYNAQNQVKKATKPDGSTESKSYDSAGRLQVYNNRTKSGRTFTAYIYMYDALGRITSELEAITMTEYVMTYDSLGRLVKRVERRYGTSEVYNTEEFTYDAAGNILTGGTEESSDTYGYGEYNRLSTVNDGWVNIDYAGNTIFCYLNNIAIDLQYDEKNRLENLSYNYGSYDYDAENNRIYADGTKYVYDTSDGRNRMAESIDSDGNITLYGYGAEGLVWSKCGDEYTVYHYDYRGSVIAVTDKDGNITDTLKYDAYGSTVEHKGSSTLLFGYNGKYGVQTDKSGYLYMRTRYYSPVFRRFMTADVIDGNIADSTTLNLYTYVNGNPISFVDPFGLCRNDGNNTGNSNYPLDPIGSNTSWFDAAMAELIQNRIVEPKYNDMVIKALNNTADLIIAKYKNKNNIYGRDWSDSFIDAINKTVTSIQKGTQIENFDPDIKIRIEIDDYISITGLNLIGDFADFFPGLGELYTVVDIMSDEKFDFSKFKSLIMSVISEGSISKLTPYIDHLEKFSEISRYMPLVGFVSDAINWNSPDNIRKRVTVFVQYNQNSSFMYDVFVDDDLSFKEFFSGYTGAVIEPDDKMLIVTYR